MVQKHIVRNKEYYLNTLNIEADLLKKAADLAERMMVAFMRENKVEVSVDVDDIAEKIINRLVDKLPKIGSYVPISGNQSKEEGFSFDDGPVIIKTEKIEVKGKIGNVTKSTDNISESLDILDNLHI